MATLFMFLVLGISVAFHEYAHGWMADRLGDPTPKSAGRLTLNPLSHIDLFGTIILPLLIVFLSRGLLPPLGRAKPVPINPYHLKDPKRDMVKVGVAGPLANIVGALFFLLLLKFKIRIFKQVFIYGFLINCLLAIFNLIPIPPLDGSRIVSGFLPKRQYRWYQKLEEIGLFIVMVLIFTLFLTGYFQRFILFLQTSLVSIHE